MFGLTALETKLAGALILVIALGITYGIWQHHERSIGAAKIVAADKVAYDKAVADVQRKNQQLTAAVNTAHQEAQNAQVQLTSYIADHPTGPVRVCHVAPARSGSVPSVADTSRGTEDTSTPAGAVPEVPDGIAGPDISPGLAVLVQAAARLAVLDSERQQIAAASARQR